MSFIEIYNPRFDDFHGRPKDELSAHLCPTASVIDYRFGEG